MRFELDTKYNPGDRVFYLVGTKISEGVVRSIQLEGKRTASDDDDLTLRYKVRGVEDLMEEDQISTDIEDMFNELRKTFKRGE